MAPSKPPPDNLGIRQHQLNTRVNNAFSKKVQFDDIKNKEETCELDKFFKIDLAAKCKNVDYIIDVFKAGETLYVQRALRKCQWIFDDEYSNIVNPEFLENNIFPDTSMRAKRLILKTIVMHMRTDDRAVLFYNYCMKIKMTDIAQKCVLFTSKEFKLNLMQSKNQSFLAEIQRKKFSYLKFIVGTSMELLEAYLSMLTKDQEKNLLKFRYLYPVDNVKYLDLLEKYTSVNSSYFDTELCEHIMKKYKDRVMSNPYFYYQKIVRDVLIKNITPEEAKIFIVTLLPSTAEEFWTSNFHVHKGNDLLNLLTHSEKFQFLKNIFNDKYPDEEFETDPTFYNQEYYKYLTLEQQEEWALNHLKSEKQILGVGNDYLWYRFINFTDAFEAIQKYIIVTKESEQRNSMVKTLIESAKNNRELETLFTYYYRRHIHEAKPNKVDFLDTVISYQNVFKFDNDCWEAFYKILLTLEIYKSNNNAVDSVTLTNYKNVTLFYHILYEKPMPEDLKVFLQNDFYPYGEKENMQQTSSIDEWIIDDPYIGESKSISPHLNKLSSDKRRFLFKYLHAYYCDQINNKKNEPYTQAGKEIAERHFDIVLRLTNMFNVNLPIPVKYTKTQRKRPRSHHPNISDVRLLLDLKADKSIVLKKLIHIKSSLQRNEDVVVFNKFLKKIKIYFPDDLRETFLDLYYEYITEDFPKTNYSNLFFLLDACVEGVFQLGDESKKLELMRKYAPKDPKIDYDTDKWEDLTARRTIARYAANSLPPIPLPDMLAYIKGDYARHCLHIFSVYIAALPMSSCVKLVQSLISSPVSIQKHALRLAVQCFSVDNLINTINDIWQKTKNVTLRGVIYKAVFNRLIDKNERDLYDTLITLTLDLHDDDQKFVFRLVESDTLPNALLGEIKKASWKAVGQFKDKEPNIGRKRRILNGIISHLNIMDKYFVRAIIDDHLNTMFVEDQLELNYSKEDITALYVEKWILTVAYILTCSNDNDDRAEYVELAQSVVKNCLEKWNEKRSENYIYQYCCWEFIQNLNDKSVEYNTYSENLIAIYEAILNLLQEMLPLYEIYIPMWDMQLVIRNNKVIKKYKHLFESDKEKSVQNSATEFGKDVAKLVLEYVHSKTYFTYFSENIIDSILMRVNELLKVIFLGKDHTEYLDDALISFAAALIEYDAMETFLLAVRILPELNIDGSSHDKYQFVIDTLLKYPHPEVQSAAYQKLHKTFTRPAKPLKRSNALGLSNRDCFMIRKGRYTRSQRGRRR